MTPTPLEIHPAALEEAARAYAWYRARSVDAANRFLEELDVALERIQMHPSSCPLLGNRMRRYPMRRYPYVIIFRVERSRIFVLAIGHGHRKPGYWRDRS